MNANANFVNERTACIRTFGESQKSNPFEDTEVGGLGGGGVGGDGGVPDGGRLLGGRDPLPFPDSSSVIWALLLASFTPSDARYS